MLCSTAGSWLSLQCTEYARPDIGRTRTTPIVPAPPAARPHYDQAKPPRLQVMPLISGRDFRFCGTRRLTMTSTIAGTIQLLRAPPWASRLHIAGYFGSQTGQPGGQSGNTWARRDRSDRVSGVGRNLGFGVEVFALTSRTEVRPGTHRQPGGFTTRFRPAPVMSEYV